MILRNQNKETGITWSIPARRMNVAQNNTFIRKDWLDKLGLDIPATTEEYVDALRAFKAMDPAEVGVASIIPFTATDDIRWRASNLLESFVDPDLTDRDRWVNTVVERNFLLPGYKEGVRLLNQMYNEGLIDPEFPLYTDDTPGDNLIKSGAVGSFIHNWDQPYRDTPGLLRDLLENVPDAEIIAIDPFVNAAGRTQKSLYDAAGLNFFIPVFSKNPEGAVRYANWMAKFENRFYLQTGDEGVTHELIDGVPKLMTAEGEKIMNSAQNIDYTFVINGLDVNNPEIYATALANSYTVDPSLIENAYARATKDGRPAIVVPGVNIISAGPVNATLVDKGKTLMAQSITAKPEDFDKVWDEAIADWLASGAQEVLEENAEKYYAP
jgi:putative aldouronate transport system substrate-binding protein